MCVGPCGHARLRSTVRGVAAIDREGLAKAIELGGWEKKQLAKKVGISPQYLADILAGRRTLKRNPALRKAMAKELGVPTRWIEREAAA